MSKTQSQLGFLESQNKALLRQVKKLTRQRLHSEKEMRTALSALQRCDNYLGPCEDGNARR